MRAAILSIGTELLMGQIVNTNTAYLSKRLNDLGIDVMYHYTVGDNSDRLADMIKTSFTDCDFVLTTGGLGPTQDDITKEIACQVLDDELVLYEDIWEHIKGLFSKEKRPLAENNIKQAIMPSRATVFPNNAGIAPGFALENNGKYLICMPGPPREMKSIFEESVVDWLLEFSNETLYSRELRFFGIGESRLEMELMPLIDGQTDPTLATYAKLGECSLRITSKNKNAEIAKKRVEDMVVKVDELVGEYIYSYDNEDLVKVVADKLISKGLSISAAESCTGGLFAATLTNMPGISESFNRSLVTYSNEAKMQELGVKAETLEKHGAVSEETAYEMVEGLHRVSGSDVCVSVTGIAGPGGGTPEKPVGLIYVGFLYGDVKKCIKLEMNSGDRARNRNYALLTMLDVINRNI